MLLATPVKQIQARWVNDNYQQRDELRPMFQKNSLIRKPLGKNSSLNQKIYFKKLFFQEFISRDSNRRRQINDDGCTKDGINRISKKKIIYGEL